MIHRCPWCVSDPLSITYHDEEWGVPVHDDGRLFEMLILEGAQAGLSWLTILRKRDNYRKAFDAFDADRVARYGEVQIHRLMNDAGIVRNHLKIEAAIRNAQGFLAIRDVHGSFDRFIWRYVDDRPVQNQWRRLSDIPPLTEQSTLMSKDLRKLGFNFVGAKICYAFMQAVGMVNDHLAGCFRNGEVRRLAERMPEGGGDHSA